ncbi:MAG: hypothetical protein U0802_16370 [Candidatus Binatia bacterium]
MNAIGRAALIIVALCTTFGASPSCATTVTPSRTATPSPSPTPTGECRPTAPPPCDDGETAVCSDYRCAVDCDCACTGDCDRDGVVGIDEIVTAVNMALNGSAVPAGCLPALCACRPGSFCANRGVTVECLVRAVGHALDGCPAAPSATPTPPLVGPCDPALNGRTDGPSPGRQVLFRLAEESTVTLPGGSVEPLRGALLTSSCFSPNTFFAARIEALRLASATALVESGCAAIGQLVASTLYGGETPVELSSAVRVGGEVLTLTGRGPHVAAPAATRLDLQLTAGGYRFHLVAVGDVTLDPEAGEPLCAAWGFG